jgi:flavodoxin
MKTLIICSSIHHKNTLKIADAIAEVLNASVIKTEDVKIEELKDYDLIGFGSGIYLWKQHMLLLRLADNLPEMNKNCFLFSTSGDKGHDMEKWHKPLREKLIGKGCKVLDEFNCLGWDTIGPLKLFGGINKGRPNEKDLENAKEFARNIVKLTDLNG